MISKDGACFNSYYPSILALSRPLYESIGVEIKPKVIVFVTRAMQFITLPLSLKSRENKTAFFIGDQRFFMVNRNIAIGIFCQVIYDCKVRPLFDICLLLL